MRSRSRARVSPASRCARAWEIQGYSDLSLKSGSSQFPAHPSCARCGATTDPLPTVHQELVREGLGGAAGAQL